MEKRREFLTNSAKLGAVALLGTSGIMSISFGAESRTKATKKAVATHQQWNLQR